MSTPIGTKFGLTTLKCGDRFLWNSHKWFILEILEDGEIAVRLEQTADVIVLPEKLVAELVAEFQYFTYFWSR